MTNSTPPPDPGERRLPRPPSDRYRVTAPVEPGATGPGAGPDATPAPPVRRRTAGRGMGFAVLTGMLSTAVTAAMAVVFAVTAGLVVAAAAAGWAVGTALRIGAGAALPPTRRRTVAVVVAIGAVALAQVVIWLIALSEGGVLSLPDYLAETYGVLVLGQALAAATTAWWTAR